MPYNFHPKLRSIHMIRMNYDMSIVSEIKLLGTGLEDGETLRTECPSCGETEGFTLTREGESLLWNCFRASCGLKPGRTGGRIDPYTYKVTPPERKFTPYTGSLEPLSSEWKEYLSEKLGFTDDHFSLSGAMYAPKEHRVAYPIYSAVGVRRGYVLRSYSFGVEPKALTRMDCTEPSTSWYRCQRSKHCIIVEDIPSAVRAAVAGDMNAVAMNGSSLGDDSINEVLAAGITSLIWAFDEDATTEALYHHRKYKMFFNECKILKLDKDLKDMEEVELCELL